MATVDRLSDGRVILSVGLGAVDSGFDAFGEETDRRIRAELMDECLDIVTGLWAGQPFKYDGKHYTITPTDVPDDRRHRAAAAGPDLVRRRRSTGRSRWTGRCAGTASSRRCSSTATASTRTLEQIAARPPGRSATGPTTS